MVKKLTLTDEHLKLITQLNFEAFEFPGSREPFGFKSFFKSLSRRKGAKHFESVYERLGWGIDQYSLYGGTYVTEETSRILGFYDQHIVGTEEDPQGVAFSDELTEHMWELHNYICNNMELILSLVLYYSNKGGLTPGTYIYSRKGLKPWRKEENN